VAKLSMINREAKRARIVKQYAVRRAALKETIRDPANSDEQRREAQQKRLQIAASRCQSDTVAQPLPADWTVAWFLSQVRSGSQQAAGSHHAWRCAGLAQSQLVNVPVNLDGLDQNSF
jgi:hypothetical protein